MGNSFVFPVPKCTYTSKSLSQFYLEFPIYRRTKDSRSNSRKQIITVPALHLRSHTKSKYLFIYAHGNSEDLGRLYFSLLDYYERFQIDILAPEYPGYGLNKGKLSPSNLVHTLEQTIFYASSPKGLNYELKNIILIGRSIGTGLVVEAATKFPELKGIILISAFLSIREVAQSIAGAFARLFISDIFKSYSLIDKVKCPTLFIHGKKDTLIPVHHSVCLYYKARCIKQLFLAEEMDHNRAKLQRDIYKPIEEFLINELQIRDHKDLFIEQTKPEDYSAIIPEFLGCKPKTEFKKRSKKRKEPLKEIAVDAKTMDDESKQSLSMCPNNNSFSSKADTSYSFQSNENESFIDDKKNLIEYSYDQGAFQDNNLMISKYLIKQDAFKQDEFKSIASFEDM